MTNLDVAGLLKTYAEKCANARNEEQLKEFVRELKAALSSKEIAKFRIIGA